MTVATGNLLARVRDGGDPAGGRLRSRFGKPGNGSWRWVSGLGFVPMVALLVVSFVWPLVTITLRSFNADGRAELGKPYFGHYADIIRDDLLRNVAQQTVTLAFISTVVTVLLAFPTAYVMANVGARLGTTMLALVLIPFWVSILVRLFAFTSILGREGVVNDALGLFGQGPLSLLFNTEATVIGMVAYLLPYMVLLLFTAMVAVDQSMVTAARTMGATGAQAFRQVYLPQIRSSLISGILLIFVLSLGFFLTPAVLGGPRDRTLPVYIQQQISLYDWGRASAAGVLLLLVSLIGFAIALRISGVSVLGAGGRPVNRGGVAREKFGRSVANSVAWIIAVLALVLLIGPLLIVVPSAFGTSSQISFPPVGFTTSWFDEVLTDPLWVFAIYKSVEVALGTALLTTMIALVTARAFTRLRGTLLRTLVQTFAFGPIIVPVILLAIGVFDVQLQLGWIGTRFGLILAHSVLAFPFAFLILSNSMGKFDHSLEEAAWSMGASRTRTLWTVVLPTQISSIVGAVVVSFMVSWDEVVIALFQTGLEKTLPVTIFSLLKSGVTPAVAAVSVVMIVPIVVGLLAWVAWTTRKLRHSKSSTHA